MSNTYLIILLWSMCSIVFIVDKLIGWRKTKKFKKQQEIITKQDRIVDVLVAVGLRETMEYQRTSFVRIP